MTYSAGFAPKLADAMASTFWGALDDRKFWSSSIAGPVVMIHLLHNVHPDGNKLPLLTSCLYLAFSRLCLQNGKTVNEVYWKLFTIVIFSPNISH
jgi:hypothetical protein